jgi:hypothetical protein
MNSVSSRGFPLKILGISCTAFGTDIYLFDWGSSLVFIDMMESTTLWIGVYPRKDTRENDYS